MNSRARTGMGTKENQPSIVEKRLQVRMKAMQTPPNMSTTNTTRNVTQRTPVKAGCRTVRAPQPPAPSTRSPPATRPTPLPTRTRPAPQPARSRAVEPPKRAPVRSRSHTVNPVATRPKAHSTVTRIPGAAKTDMHVNGHVSPRVDRVRSHTVNSVATRPKAHSTVTRAPLAPKTDMHVNGHVSPRTEQVTRNGSGKDVMVDHSQEVATLKARVAELEGQLEQQGTAPSSPSPVAMSKAGSTGRTASSKKTRQEELEEQVAMLMEENRVLQQEVKDTLHLMDKLNEENKTIRKREAKLGKQVDELEDTIEDKNREIERLKGQIVDAVARKPLVTVPAKVSNGSESDSEEEELLRPRARQQARPRAQKVRAPLPASKATQNPENDLYMPVDMSREASRAGVGGETRFSVASEISKSPLFRKLQEEMKNYETVGFGGSSRSSLEVPNSYNHMSLVEQIKSNPVFMRTSSNADSD